jgi:hypothetical protein
MKTLAERIEELAVRLEEADIFEGDFEAAAALIRWAASKGVADAGIVRESEGRILELVK